MKKKKKKWLMDYDGMRIQKDIALKDYWKFENNEKDNDVIGL